jgi:hypothetical protein
MHLGILETYRGVPWYPADAIGDDMPREQKLECPRCGGTLGACCRWHWAVSPQKVMNRDATGAIRHAWAPDLRVE